MSGADAISFSDLIEEAELHALGLRDRVQQLAANRRIAGEAVTRLRERIPVAEGIVATLKRVAEQDGRVRS